MGSGKIVTDYTIEGHNANRCAKDWTLQGSNDNSSWTTIDTVTGQTGWTNYQTRYFKVDTPGSYRYYKLVVSANNGASDYVSIAEIQLKGEVSYTENGTISDATKPGQGSVAFSAGNNTYPGTKAFDDKGNVGDGRWLANKPTSSNPSWIRYDFAEGKKIIEYTVQSQSYNWAQRAPKDWTLQGSNDNSNWTTIDTVTSQTGWTQWETRSFTVDSVGTYRWYKLVFTDNNGDGTLGIGEIELKVRDGLYGFPANLTLNETKADGFKYSQVASSAGRDLRFTDSTGGTLLPYQIDEWAPGGDSRIWVKIPEIKPSVEGNTTITLWWGNENAISAFPDYVSNGEVWSAYAVLLEYG